MATATRVLVFTVTVETEDEYVNDAEDMLEAIREAYEYIAVVGKYGNKACTVSTGSSLENQP